MKKLLLCIIAIATSLFSYSQNIIDFAGNGNIGYGGDGYPANSGFCELYQPTGVYVDKFGNTYISDNANNVIRKVNTSGIISTFAGIRMVGYGGYSGDGGPATDAELNVPIGLSGDTNGNIYIADYDNGVIRMVNTSGIISTVAGSGFRGYSGDGGPATDAEMYLPGWVFIDNKENMYISEYGDSRIRMINTSGIISTYAGNGILGYSGDGGAATAAEVWCPMSVYGDSAGNIYIAQTGGSIIRKVNTSGIISTIAGNGTSGYTGDGVPATSTELDFPVGLCFDASGNLLFCDEGNYRVRAINTSGIITTIAGNGDGGFTGDGGPATVAELLGPYGIAVNQYGNVCFADFGNNQVREIVYHPTGIENITDKEDIVIYPNPVNQQLNLQFNKQVSGLATLTIMDITGREVLSCEKNISNGITQVDVSSLSTGMYFMSLKNKDVSLTQKFLKN